MFLRFPIFPPEASISAERVDALYTALLIMAAFFSVLIFTLIIVFSIKYYRGKTVNREIRRHDYLKLEITWIGLPFLICVGIFIWGSRLYFDLYTPPRDAMEMYVVGKQWMWKIQHPEGNREINELHIPVGRDIRLIMTSEDVIHSFFIPAFRIKQDVLPGRFTYEWFRPIKVGEYHLFCAEYCGTGHSAMVGRVVVMDPIEYSKWLAATANPEGSSMAVSGQQLFNKFGCAACHTNQPSARGPSLVGIYGTTVSLEGGGTAKVDMDYLREKLTEPQMRVVLGYPHLMPTFRDQLSPEQMGQLIEFIRSLKPGGVSSGNPEGGLKESPSYEKESKQ